MGQPRGSATMPLAGFNLKPVNISIGLLLGTYVPLLCKFLFPATFPRSSSLTPEPLARNMDCKQHTTACLRSCQSGHDLLQGERIP
jgi:hypothetical protein